jgi:hypothetical protein
MNSARADDTKNLKPVIVDWIESSGTEAPLLRRTSKKGRGFDSDTTGRLLCPVGVDWNDPKLRFFSLLASSD